jgi:predicted DNA-binding transcriptional regulator AlpA
MSADWISGAEVRERTGWNAQQLRRRIAHGKFPAKVDVDRWNRADVEAYLSGKTSNEGWTVNEEAIRLAVAGYVRRAQESARRRRQRGNMAHPL